MRSTGRRGLLLGFMAGITVLAMAGSAFACTVYKGKVTFTANTPGSGVAFAEGKPGLHEYCSGQARQNIAIVGTFTVAIAPSIAGTACPTGGTVDSNPNNLKVKDGMYDLLYLPVSTALPSTANNCNLAGSPIGRISVTAGSGSGTFAMPPTNGPPPIGHVNFCVTPIALPIVYGALNNGADPGTRDSAPELHLNLTLI